jgi:hypothetical protein
MFGEVDPASGWIHGAMPTARLVAGRDGETSDGVACHLALAAAETTDGVAHEQDLSEVVAAQGGATKVLAGAELALNRNAVIGIQAKVGNVFGRVGILTSPTGFFEFVGQVHVQRFLSSGDKGRSKSFSVSRRELPGVRGVRIG